MSYSRLVDWTFVGILALLALLSMASGTLQRDWQDVEVGALLLTMIVLGAASRHRLSRVGIGRRRSEDSFAALNLQTMLVPLDSYSC
jgi:hypothetical protein